MFTSIFITLPVANISRSREFFNGLGFTFNEDFSDEETTCMIVTDTIMVIHIDESGSPTLVSLPRDSYITIPAHIARDGSSVKDRKMLTKKAPCSR
ncbi:MAG: hypothetical protein RLZZ52_435, partial [Actinomycetota bacterium]